jgi:hypothetical protein
VETFLKVLSDEECQRIHEETLRILSQTGVRIDTRKVDGYLEEAGALWTGDIYRPLPNRLVEMYQIGTQGIQPGCTASQQVNPHELGAHVQL